MLVNICLLSKCSINLELLQDADVVMQQDKKNGCTTDGDAANNVALYIAKYDANCIGLLQIRCTSLCTEETM